MASKGVREEVEEIIVDCYSEEEEQAAWEVAFQDRVAVPFCASVLRAPVEVHAFRAADDGHPQCLVVTGNQKRWMGVESLDEAELPDDLQHVLELYDAWLSGDY